MDRTLDCALAVSLARELRAARDELTGRWLERIAARVSLDRNEIFPSEDLLDHVPLLIDGIAGYLEDPAEVITADMPVLAKAIELGELRHRQGFSAYEILKEYEILGGVLFAFLSRIVEEINEPCTRSDLLACSHRLFRALSFIQQVTTTHYLGLSDELVREREDRLRGFNRTLSHEMKNRIGSLLGAAAMLREKPVQRDAEQLERFVEMVVSNAGGMHKVVEDLLTLSRTHGELRRQRNVLLPEAVTEVVRQLREMAASRRVAVRISPPLPPEEVNAGVVELCLSNYVSNAIKYADPTQPTNWVEVSGRVGHSEWGRELVIAVRDNGLGVPPEERNRLFERFFRSDQVVTRGIEGTGLGLSIVREIVHSVGGRAWAEFEEERGSTFLIALPLRRSADAVSPPPDSPQ